MGTRKLTTQAYLILDGLILNSLLWPSRSRGAAFSVAAGTASITAAIAWILREGFNFGFLQESIAIFIRTIHQSLPHSFWEFAGADLSVGVFIVPIQQVSTAETAAKTAAPAAALFARWPKLVLSHFSIAIFVQLLQGRGCVGNLIRRKSAVFVRIQNRHDHNAREWIREIESAKTAAAAFKAAAAVCRLRGCGFGYKNRRRYNNY